MNITPPLQNLIIPVNETNIHSNLNVFFSEDDLYDSLNLKIENNSKNGEMNPQSDDSDGMEGSPYRKINKTGKRDYKHSNRLFKKKNVKISCKTVNTFTKNSMTPRIFRILEIKMGKNTLFLHDNYTFVNDNQKEILESNYGSKALEPNKRSQTMAKYQLLTRQATKKSKRVLKLK